MSKRCFVPWRAYLICCDVHHELCRIKNYIMCYITDTQDRSTEYRKAICGFFSLVQQGLEWACVTSNTDWLLPISDIMPSDIHSVSANCIMNFVLEEIGTCKMKVWFGHNCTHLFSLRLHHYMPSSLYCKWIACAIVTYESVNNTHH